MPHQATICEKAAGSTAFMNTKTLPAPVASSVLRGISSKLSANDFVKKAVVWTQSPATPYVETEQGSTNFFKFISLLKLSINKVI